ncbi:MAG: hypothetical protein Q8L48_37960 [Archangium sp.]|nr:hypothetical protein [Archangium sp.]
MRWLLVVVAVGGCGVQPSTICSDSPLGGTCTHVEGTWRLLSGQRATRCGGVAFLVEGEPSCETQWQFTATRE